MKYRLTIVLFLTGLLNIKAYGDDQTIRLQLKWEHAFQFAGYYAAQELGYYDQAGLNVEIVPADTSTNVYEEVKSGRAQYGVGNSSVLVQRNNGDPFVILAVVFQHSPAILIAKNDVLTFHDWNTKKIMLEESSDELMLFLENEGLNLEDLNFLPHTFDPIDLTTDHVDIMSAYSTNEPYFLSKANIPFRTFVPRSAGIDFFGDNLFTSEHEIAKNPKRVQAFRSASLKGWQFAMDNPETVINWIISRYKSTYSRDFLEFEANAMYPLIQPDLIELGYLNPSRWHKVVKAYQARKKLDNNFQIENALYKKPEASNHLHILIGLAIATPILVILGGFALFVIRTNRKLDNALRESLAARAEATKQANLDPLTNLANRRFFQKKLQHLCQMAKSNNTPFGLFYLDLDHFKEVNDIHGHREGDNVLKDAGERLQRTLPSNCELARIGGDEFTILIPGIVDEAALGDIANNVLKAFESPFRIGVEQVSISASIGITACPKDAQDESTLLQFADEAMYAAKNSGRRQYHIFSQELHAMVLERQHVLSDMRHAIPRGEMYLKYQPILDLNAQEIVKFEALIRWNHPTKGAIPPSMFIPLAEESGLIGVIGDFVFSESILQLAKWRKTLSPNLVMSINTSPFQYMESGKNLERWFHQLDQLDLPGDAIIFEITENMLMHHSSNVSDQLLALRDKGINVALDDFGTGYSSLAYLNRFDIDFIKIDQSFIRDMESGAMAQDLCEAIVSMAHKLNLHVVAEGIETEHQMNLLIKYGCDLGQGYYFSYPLEADAATTLLEQGINLPNTENTVF
ncbi:EAL domain-containing protein [Marinomonas mediterranea]|uniref:EAL domain-containing protein n=1 Tax=Marinomonas mediterranea TaxID=119864 RepID=UPI00234B00E6|nr:EAL domain-containing protein [Marinomonas mediterranea]WCN08174.1 EAL domain-containing protein [Marinomonas mediterranea]